MIENDFDEQGLQELAESSYKGFAVLDRFYAVYGKNITFVIIISTIFIFYMTFELYATLKKQYQIILMALMQKLLNQNVPHGCELDYEDFKEAGRKNYICKQLAKGLRSLHSRLDYIERALENHKKNIKNRLHKVTSKMKSLKRKPQESSAFIRFEEKLCENASLLRQMRNEMKQIFGFIIPGLSRRNYQEDINIQYELPEASTTNLVLEERQDFPMKFTDDNLLNRLECIEQILNVANKKADMKIKTAH